MDKYLKLEKEERELIISNVADKKRLSKAIVEKDFWVGWTLNYLINLSIRTLSVLKVVHACQKYIMRLKGFPRI